VILTYDNEGCSSASADKQPFLKFWWQMVGLLPHSPSVHSLLASTTMDTIRSLAVLFTLTPNTKRNIPPLAVLLTLTPTTKRTISALAVLFTLTPTTKRNIPPLAVLLTLTQPAVALLSEIILRTPTGVFFMECDYNFKCLSLSGLRTR